VVAKRIGACLVEAAACSATVARREVELAEREKNGVLLLALATRKAQGSVVELDCCVL
jgi:hypothetical protein